MDIASLDAEFQKVKAIAQKEHDWYARHRWGYVVFSWLIRIMASACLLLATVLPLSKSVDPITVLGIFAFAGPSQAAIACIALAGLAVAANQVFLISATWIRYVNAMMKIKTLILVAELDWRSQRDGLTDPVPTLEVQKALSIFKALVVSSRQIVEAETSSWSAELVKAIEELKSLVQEQKATVDTMAKEEQKAIEAAHKLAAAPTLGTVRVKLEGAVERLTGSIKISIANKSEERAVPVSTVVLTDVGGGIQKVLLMGTDSNGKRISSENAVQVTPNAITEVPLVVPSG